MKYNIFDWEDGFWRSGRWLLAVGLNGLVRCGLASARRRAERHLLNLRHFEMYVKHDEIQHILSHCIDMLLKNLQIQLLFPHIR